MGRGLSVKSKGSLVGVALLSFGLILGMQLATDANSQVNEWEVTWEPIVDGVFKKSYKVTIQNLNPSGDRQFNMSLLLDELAFDESDVKNIKIMEQINQSYVVTVPVYESVNIDYEKEGNYTSAPSGCRELNVTHYTCPTLRQNGRTTETRYRNVFQEITPSISETNSRERKEHVGSKTVNRLGTQNVTRGTSNGTAVFLVEFEVPFGTSGRVGFFEEDSQVLYHPFFNTSWSYQKQINVTNNDGSGGLTNGLTINLTFDHADLVNQSKSNANGTDVRIVENNETELDSVLCLGSSWNTTTTCLNFNLTSDLAAGATNSTGFQLYYGNPIAGPRPENLSKVFIIGETWDSGSAIYPWNSLLTGASTTQCSVNLTNDRLNLLDLNTENACIYWLDLADINYGNLTSWRVQSMMNYTGTGTAPHTGLFLSMANRPNFTWSGVLGELENFTGFRVTLSAPTSSYNIFHRVNAGGTFDGTSLNASTTNANNITLISDGTTKTLIINDTFTQTETFASEGGSEHFYLFMNQGTAGWFQAGNGSFDDLRLMHYHSPEPTTSLGSEQSQAVASEITLISPTNGTSTNNPFPEFQFTVTTAGENISAEVFVDNGTLTSVGSNSSVTNNTLTTITPGFELADGTYTWYVNATVDGNGNRSANFTLSVSKVAMGVSIISPANDTNISSGAPNVTFNITGNTTGNRVVLFFRNSTGTVFHANENASVPNGTQLSLGPNTTLDDGTYFAYLNATFGDVSNVSSEVAINIDTVAPSTSAITPQNDSVQYAGTGEIHTFAINATDSTTGIRNATFQFNGANMTSTLSGDTYSVGLTGLGVSTNTFKWIIEDYAGNANTSDTYTYGIIDSSQQSSGGGGSPSSCGNGVCDIFETHSTCPADCMQGATFTVSPESLSTQSLRNQEAVCSGLFGCMVIITNPDTEESLHVIATIRQNGDDVASQWASFVQVPAPVNGVPETQRSLEIGPGQSGNITFRIQVPEDAQLGVHVFNIEFSSSQQDSSVPVQVHVVDSDFGLAITGMISGTNGFLNHPIWLGLRVWHAMIVVTGVVVVAYLILMRK